MIVDRRRVLIVNLRASIDVTILEESFKAGDPRTIEMLRKEIESLVVNIIRTRPIQGHIVDHVIEIEEDEEGE